LPFGLEIGADHAGSRAEIDEYSTASPPTGSASGYAADAASHLLEERAFKPVLNAKPKGLSEAEQKQLEHVQKATHAESAFTNTVRGRML
jgi:hypothetical protein